MAYPRSNNISSNTLETLSRKNVNNFRHIARKAIMSSKASVDSSGKKGKRPNIMATSSRGISAASGKGEPPKSNPQLRRQALGRGLGALMRSTLVDIDVTSQLSAKPEPLNQSVSQRTGIAIQEPAHLESASSIEAIKARFDEVNSRKAKDLVKALTTSNAEATDSVESFEEEGDRAGEFSIRQLSLSSIRRNVSQPREFFADDEIDSLAGSIKSSGLLQPIIVRPHEVDGAKFEIVAGERRFRAAERAGLQTIPAIVRNLTDKETLELAIVENVQRSDLNPIEEARAYRRLIDEFASSQEEVAKTVGKDRVSVANALRLLRLPTDIQEELINKTISAGHGRALLMLDNEAKQRSLLRKIIELGLSVREAERLARGGEIGAGGGSGEGASRRREEKFLANPAVQRLEERFRRALGTKVALTMDSKGAGELRINFFSQAELDSLLDRLDA